MEIIYFVIKKGYTLTCTDTSMLDFWQLQDGLYECKLKKHRNIRHHRKFFAMLNFVLHNSERYASKEDILNDIKYALGLYRIKEIDGKEYIEFKSISFDKMDEVEFSDFYNRAIFYLSEVMNMSKEELEYASENNI